MFELALATCLIALRIGPVLTFAPPFSLIPIPSTVRAALVIALALALAGLDGTAANRPWQDPLITAAASELALGLALALLLQGAFAMIALAGRAIDIQAGFGLAFVVDPTTRAQMPLIGALFTYAAAAVFFAVGGPYDVLAVLAASFETLPLGSAMGSDAPQQVIVFLGSAAVLALGVAGLISAVLLLIDLVIALMSRTLPQMNVLVLGFQVKAMATLLLLPATLSLAAAVIARLLRLAVEAMARVV